MRFRFNCNETDRAFKKEVVTRDHGRNGAGPVINEFWGGSGRCCCWFVNLIPNIQCLYPYRDTTLIQEQWIS